MKNKILKNYRLYENDVEKLKAISERTGLSQTRIIERALARYFDELANGKPA